MKLLLINPNTTQAMTDRLERVARTAAHPDTEIITLTAPRGVPYIASRSEAAIAAHVVLEMLAAHAPSVDAAVIGAFGDPGLLAARELFDLPVTGMAEASMLSACMLGARFAIVTFTPDMRAWYSQAVALAGLERRFAGVFCPETHPEDVVGAAERQREALVALADQAARAGADAVILGGAPLAGLAGEIGHMLPAVALDPVSAAVVQAEALVRLAPRGACLGSFARPRAKASTGLDPVLAAWIAQTKTGR
ncbi:MAG: aspartate/glutamate racemase family protein [Pseudomonadota bacterium]